MKILNSIDRFGSLAVLLLVLGLAFAQVRVVTYASGTDVMTYVRAANELLSGDWPGESGVPYAPLYVVILAAAIYMAGVFAPYWVNVFFVLGALLLLRKILLQIAGDRHLASLCVAGVLAGLACFYPNTLNFLLMPFRESASFLFITLGFLLTLTGASSRFRFVLLPASCVCICLAAATREPSFIAIIGSTVYLLLDRAFSTRRRGFHALLFLSPLLLAALVALMTTSGRAILFNNQALGWMNHIETKGLEYLSWQWSRQGPRALSLLHEIVGYTGWALFVLGWVWSIIKRQAAIPLLFGVTAILLFVFYGMMEAHHRYLVSVLWFMLPVMAYGLFMTFLWPVRAWLTNRPTIAAICAYIALFCISLLGAKSIAGLQPMGTQTTASQIKHMMFLADQWPANTRDVALTQYSRYALDALQSFTRRTCVDVTMIDEEILGTRSHVIIAPQNDQAFFRFGYFPYQGLDALAIVDYHADTSLMAKDLGHAIFSLGGGDYAVYVSQPRSTNSVEHVLTDMDVTAGLIWLDFRDSNPLATRSIEITDAQGAMLLRSRVDHGQGLIPVRFSDPLSNKTAKLRVSSTDLLPRQLVVHPHIIVGHGGWWFDHRRRPSQMQWLHSPINKGDVENKWGGVFDVEGRFTLPKPLGCASNIPVSILFILEPVRKANEDVVFNYTMDDEDAGSFTNRIDRQNVYHAIHVTAKGTSPAFDIRLRAVSASSLPSFRVALVGVAVD